jgi:excisionase family DNA binding protein
MAPQKILTISEVAQLLKVHPITVYRLIKQGKLPYFRIGRVLRFDADQLEDWVRLKHRNVEVKNGRRKNKAASSAEYVAYRRGEFFRPENLLETLAISRPQLVRPFVDAKETGHKQLVCERCREARKPIAGLLLFASEQAKRPWKKAAMPFCRTCFAALKKLARPEASGRTALAAASKTDRKQARRSATQPR